MKLSFFGGAKEVTGSNYRLSFKDRSCSSGFREILIDCGLHQGSNFCERHNYDSFDYDPTKISEVFVTHAHIDHIGRLPKLVRDGFRGKVYSTAPTKEFARFMLYDCDHILSQEAEREKMPMIFSMDDINQLMSLWCDLDYGKKIHLGSEKDGADVILHPAGHILGSATVEFEAEGKTILFSGDLGNAPAPLIASAEAPKSADYAILESAYGDRIHEPAEERVKKLEEVILEVVKSGGTLMIPAFALERTQILLFEIHDLLKKHQIPNLPIFLDSPLAIRLTSVYSKYSNYFKKEVAKRFETQEEIFNFPNLHFTEKTEESKAINDVPGPKIVIAGSGMSHGGRILHHEKRYLKDPKSALLIFGYQADGSLGRRLLEKNKTVKILGEEVPVRARIRAIGAYSAHADQNQLLNWLKPLEKRVKKVFLVQGEEGPAEALKKRIESDLGLKAEVPNLKQSVNL